MKNELKIFIFDHQNGKGQYFKSLGSENNILKCDFPIMYITKITI